MTGDSVHSSLVRADGEIDLAELMRTLWKARWFIVVTVTLFTLAFGVYAFTTPRVYRGSAVLLPNSHDRGMRGLLESTLGFAGGGLASLAGLGTDRSTRQVEEALAVLKSRSFIEAFIAKRDLMKPLFADEERQPTPAEAYRFFTKNVLLIERDNKTGLISLHVEWRDRTMAALWANDLVDEINVEMRKRALEKADISLKFLETESKNTMLVGPQEAINRLIDAQISERMLASVTQEYAFQIVDKALPPDADDPVRPKRRMLILLGFIIGGAASVGAVLARRLVRL